MSESFQLVIVGGVAGGASAAARARRLSEKAEIIIFERGEHISFANCGLPYHLGGEIQNREDLFVMTAEQFRERFNIEVRVRWEVTRLDRATRKVIAKNLVTGEERAFPYDALILSPGAAPVRPPLPGIELPGIFTLRNISDIDAINQVIAERQPRRVVVVGGGYVGLEMTEALRGRGLSVSLVESLDQVLASCAPELAALLHNHLRDKGVELRLGQAVNAFYKCAGGMKVELSSGEQLDAELVILAVGVRPEIKLAKDAGLRIGELGGIAVDEHLRTSDPAIYAIGDAIEAAHLVTGRPALLPLAGPAARQGRIAADNVFGRPAVYAKTQGTAICRIFDLTCGMTGVNEEILRHLGWKYEKVHLHPASHAGYFPGAGQLHLLLLFNPDDGRIYGAQAVGAEGVDKRLDVLAVAIRAGLTVFDLEEMELSYAPPYGSVKDPINYAGFIAANVIRGDVKISQWTDLLAEPEKHCLLDVRNPGEIQAGGSFPGALLIPLPELRARLGELPRDQPIHVYCRVGLRSYLACRILSQNGFDVFNVSGGYLTYLATGGAPVIN